MISLAFPKEFRIPKSAFRVLSQTLNRTKSFSDMRESFVNAIEENLEDMNREGVTAMDCARFLDFVVKNRLYKVIQ